MAEDVGKMLDLLNNPELSSLYHSSIRDMQPADLVRRLESEGVSTRGHMSELRARLLRVEARKLQARSAVPWYPEDEVSRKKVDTSSNEKVTRQATVQLVISCDTAKPSVESKTTANVAIIAPDEFMKTMVQLGFWNPDGKPVEPKEATSSGKARNARSRLRKAVGAYYRPLYTGILSDMDKKFKELSLMSREARRHGMEDYEKKIKLLASELRKKVQMETKNTGTPQRNQDTSKLPVNHRSSVTGESAAPLLQRQETKPSNEPVPSTSYDTEVKYQPKTPLKSYTHFRRSFANEDLDDDPFEHVDSTDWMDDFIE